MYKRWQKLEIDFFSEKDNIYLISKIPDIFDSIRYDKIHNQVYLQKFGDTPIQILYLSELLSSFVTPNELGIDDDMKIDLGLKIILPLYEKIK